MIAAPVRRQLVMHAKSSLERIEAKASICPQHDVVMGQAWCIISRARCGLVQLHEDSHLHQVDLARACRVLVIDQPLRSIQKSLLDPGAVECARRCHWGAFTRCCLLEQASPWLPRTWMWDGDQVHLLYNITLLGDAWVWANRCLFVCGGLRLRELRSHRQRAGQGEPRWCNLTLQTARAMGGRDGIGVGVGGGGGGSQATRSHMESGCLDLDFTSPPKNPDELIA